MRLDWAIAAIVALLSLAEEIGGRTGEPDRANPALWIGFALACAVLVAFRRRVPFTALAVYTLVGGPAIPLSGETLGAWQFYVELLLLFTLMAEVPPRDRRTPAGLALALGFIGLLLFTDTGPVGPGDIAIALVMATVAGGAGFAVQRYRVVAAQAQERGALLAREAVNDERNRIARELHDIVAHSVSVMVMQSGAVRRRLTEEQAREREALMVVEATGRAAVHELSRILGLLRSGSEGADTTPQPSLGRLEELVEQVRVAGLDVKLDVRGEPAQLSAGLELSAYRIIQEALTNALKHAGPTRVVVTVAHRHKELFLEIADEGPTPGHATPEPRGLGHGLIGMRERVALFDGRLDAHPRFGGGFIVRATLPA
ncbi:sensor histidine kinase [Nonomuraea africana]|uniref:histidine kinase n=1 Tax=Nonomuraea africana TaxID=46171 RepID=A0ABR9KLP8_9ACTN|nr:histidine kinase [Nonomuraea africana]MBE1562706.1 signal transduction histidine kinase [Nonomuraea africana]